MKGGLVNRIRIMRELKKGVVLPQWRTRLFYFRIFWQEQRFTASQKRGRREGIFLHHWCEKEDLR